MIGCDAWSHLYLAWTDLVMAFVYICEGVHVSAVGVLALSSFGTSYHSSTASVELSAALALCGDINTTLSASLNHFWPFCARLVTTYLGIKAM